MNNVSTKLKGKVFKCSDNIDTDVIIPAKYLNRSDEDYLGQHCLEPLWEDGRIRKIGTGDIIIAGKNFGCGSSREHAPVSIKAAGVKCVVAVSFARIFFRNAINIGLPVVELKDADKLFEFDDEIEVDLVSGLVKNLSSGKEYKVNPFPEFLQKIISCGGLVEFVRKELI